MKLKRVKPVAIPMHIMAGYVRRADETPARIEYSAQPARLPKIEAMYPFHVV